MSLWCFFNFEHILLLVLLFLVNFELGICRLCMSLVIFVIPVFYFDHSSVHMLMFSESPLLDPFVLNISSFEIFKS